MIYQLKDLTIIRRGCQPFPVSKYLSNTGYPWLKITDFKLGDRVVNNTHEFIKHGGINKTKLVPKGTLVVSSSGTLGIPIFTGSQMCLYSGFIYFEKLSDKIMPLYLFYYLLKLRQTLQTKGTGAAIKHLQIKTFETLKIDLPSIDNQIHIVNTILFNLFF